MRKRDIAASFPLLGLLALGPASGYELKKQAARSIAFFWQDGFAQIYSSLRLFESLGFAVRDPVNEHAARKVITYRITDTGRAAFLAWLAQPVESYAPRRHELLAKLFFASLVPPEVLRGHLERYRELQLHMLAELSKVSDMLLSETGNEEDQGLKYWRLTVEHGMAIASALHHWSNHAIGTVVSSASVEHKE